jgi:hypothetical protein
MFGTRGDPIGIASLVYITSFREEDVHDNWDSLLSKSSMPQLCQRNNKILQITSPWQME